MSGYFDGLESELREAVGRTARAGRERPDARGVSDIGRHIRGRYPNLLALVPALGVAVALVVVVVAVALLGHRQATHTAARHPSPSITGSRSYPTLATLEDNLAVLRRPQTAADRSWQPAVGTPNGVQGVRLVPELTRRAATLPGGDRVFLTVWRNLRGRGEQGRGTYLLSLWILAPGGAAASTDFGPNVNYTVYGLQQGDVWAGIVPDGVARVRWGIRCQTAEGPCRRSVTVRVHDNVAAAAIPHTSSRDVLVPTTTWLDGKNSEVASFAGHGNLSRPPFFVPKLTQMRSAGLLEGDGIVGVRFGATQSVAKRAVERMLGRPAGAESAADCGVRSVAWPVIGATTGGAQHSGGLELFFDAHRRLVGYQVSGSARAAARFPAGTDRGLQLGDTTARARLLYGSAFATSTAQGGSYSITTSRGSLKGYIVNGRITAIAAGDDGCPAMTP